MLPQSVWADAVLTGTTLTITTTAAGQVSGAVSSLSGDQKAAVKTIVLIGKFNSDDLVAIKGNDGSGTSGAFTGVTTVDMADAKFVVAVGYGTVSSYKLFNETTSGTSYPYDHAIVGGELYKSTQSTLAWTFTGAPASESEGASVGTISDLSDTSVAPENALRKYQNGYKYLRMQVTKAWVGPFTDGPSDAIDLSGSSVTESTINTILDNDTDYPIDKSVWFYRYYKWNGSAWVEATSSEYDTAAAQGKYYDNPSGVNLNYLDPAFGRDGFVMRVKVYYTKTAQARSWVEETTVDPGTPTIPSPEFEYVYRENHKEGFVNNEWVRVINYEYYRLQGTGAWSWTVDPISYSDGVVQNITKKYATSGEKTADSSYPTGENQYAIVGGTEYIYDEGWVLASDVTEAKDYGQMKFTYWKGSLTKAVTSKYADENINEFLFDGCNSLTEVDYKGGNVTGFIHISGADESLKVKIGKNVTKVSAAAFNGCTELRTLEFYTDADDDIVGATYPREMIIENDAFLACHNLTSSKEIPIVIPNRVSAIGNNAFKGAGGADEATCKNIYFDFERRYDGSTPINGYNGTLLTIGTDAFAYCKGLKDISLPIRMTEMGDGIFQNSGLEHFEIREDIEDAKVTTIPSNAFLACKLKDIDIPGSVTEIQGGAFSNTPTIETIRFKLQTVGTGDGGTQAPLIIHTGAFSGGNEKDQSLKDVYVDFKPSARMVVCEYNAFNFTSMVGQTSETSTQFAKLHFPNTDDAWDFYQGNWKRGLAFKQTNLNAFKDGYTGKWGGVSSEADCVGFGTVPIDASTGKYHKAGYDDKYVAPANGWQQFTSTSTEIDIIIPWGTFMRTYSSKSAYVIPKFTQEESGHGITVHANEPMFDIYRITAFDDHFVTSGENQSNPNDETQARAAAREATATQVLKEDRIGRNYIPSNTGVIMVGKVNADYVVYFAKPDFTDMTETTYPFNVTETNTNYLYPTCIDDQDRDGTFTGETPNKTDSKYSEGAPRVTTNSDGQSIVTLNSTIPYPYYKAEDVQFRIFGYSPSINKFIRTEGAWSTRDKAYLKLPSSVFHWTCEYTGDNEGSGNGSGVTAPTTAGTRTITLNFIEDEEENGTTGIKQVNTTTQRMDSNVFYTLEGVRLNARPTQRGIYIHNGRKVVIK